MEKDKQEIDIIYKGFRITYNEDRESYTSDIDDYAKERQSLKACKKAISDLVTGQSLDVKAFFVSYGGEENVTITKIDAGKTYDKHQAIWIKKSNGDRKKVGINDLYEATQNNEVIFEEIKKIENEIREKQKEISLTKARLKKITLESLQTPR